MGAGAAEPILAPSINHWNSHNGLSHDDSTVNIVVVIIIIISHDNSSSFLVIPIFPLPSFPFLFPSVAVFKIIYSENHRTGYIKTGR